MDGGLVSFGGSIHDVLDVVLANLRANRKGPFVAWLRRAVVRGWRPINQFNARTRARRNVAHHYDLNGRLYTCSSIGTDNTPCAYFPKGAETLEEAQEAKKHYIAAKLCLDRPGLSVLDISCGWGGMALTLPRDARWERTDKLPSRRRRSNRPPGGSSTSKLSKRPAHGRGKAVRAATT